jgi:hypothetical protein
MEDCAPFAFLKGWAWWFCICVLSFIFSVSLFWKNMFLKLKGGAYLLQSCLHAMRDGLLIVVKEMHPSFENLVVIGAPSLQASLMDIHHNTSLKFILENGSISLASKARICSYSSKRARLWLVVKSSISLFRIAHFTFTSALRFHLNLIQPSTFCFLKCECGHKLETFNTHLTIAHLNVNG